MLFGKVAMFIKGLWSKYAMVNYEAKVNCNSISCFKISPLSHLLFSNLALVLVMWCWLNRWAHLSWCVSMVSQASYATTTHKPWVGLRIPCISKQWLSDSALNPHGNLVLPVLFRDTYFLSMTPEGSGSLLPNKPSWGSVSVLMFPEILYWLD